VYVATQEARHRCGCNFGASSWLKDDGNGRMLLLRYIYIDDNDRVKMFMVDFTDGKGSLTLVEDQEYIYSCFRPLLALGSMFTD
jgi:hypothetical protein